MKKINITDKAKEKVAFGEIPAALGAELMVEKSKVDGVVVAGRHLGSQQFRHHNISTSYHATIDGIVLRLDDITIPEWWQEIYISKETLRKLYYECENGKEEA